jgi:hypothetical protein
MRPAGLTRALSLPGITEEEPAGVVGGPEEVTITAAGRNSAGVTSVWFRETYEGVFYPLLGEEEDEEKKEAAEMTSQPGVQNRAGHKISFTNFAQCII